MHTAKAKPNTYAARLYWRSEKKIMQVKRFKTISEFLQFRGMPKPEHPLICVFQVESVEALKLSEPESWLYDFYCIGLKRVANANEFKLKYGQQ
ncbi:MAG TPA: hypothetical protein VGC08_15850, partial [Pedobacter sp.]